MLMKKIGLLLMGLLALSSCEQEELSDFVKGDVNSLQTRTVSSIADFNPINELADIPVNILNVGNTSRRYLSCVKSGTKVDLSTKDDGSLRQRWYVSGFGTIVLVGGNTSFSSFPFIYIGTHDINVDYPILKGKSSLLFEPHEFELLSNGTYNIRYISPGIFSSYYLQSKSGSSADLVYKAEKTSNLAQWELALVGEYELVDLEYVRVTVDNFEPSELICDRDEYTNHTSSVNTWNYSLTTTYTENSNFSKTEGVNVSVSNGMSIGLPNILGEGSSIGFNTTIQQQSSRSWTYGTSDTKTITKTRTGQIPVQPGETVALEATLTMYKGSLTYVATLRKIGDTKTFRVKGKWSGDCFSSFKAHTYNPSTGKLLGEYPLE